MGFYHLTLDPDTQKLCTIVLPWGKYEYLRLPMGVCNSPDLFQEHMSELMAGLEFVRVYIDDILCLTKGDFDDHLQKLEQVFMRIQDANLRINAEKSFFAKSEVEYLGFKIDRQGIRPIAKKVEAIQALQPPETRRQLRRFIGMINYYRDMWPRRSEILSPLTKLTSKSVPFKWTDTEQKAFETMKKIISEEVLLSYPDFSKPFVIHADASHTQLGAVITQNDQPIAFYSRKLNDQQKRYTTTERELLSIVETLKEFRNILYGQQLIVYTDHKNLTYKDFNTERVMRWHLIIEEFNPEIRYIKGEHNIVADSLSRLPRTSDIAECNTIYEYSELFQVNELSADDYPVSYSIIDKYQRKDKHLLKLLKSGKYSANAFPGGEGEVTLICYQGKIIIPEQLCKRVVTWYHTYLLHPGQNRTESTIEQHLYWPDMRTQIREICDKCPSCQINKRTYKKYGHLPAKEAEAEPWERLCVDLIGPYKIAQKGKKKLLKLQALTMIDPATGWFEIVEYNDKKSITIANLMEMTWLSRYPRPSLIQYDQGSEFIGNDFRSTCQNEYGIKTKPSLTKNPQSNAIIERIHQVISNMIKTFELENIPLDPKDPWSGILAATAYAVRSTYHTTLQATPGQLVYGRDMIFNIKHVANWQAIKERKQKLINKNNERENKKRIKHTYQVDEKVLLIRHDARK